MARTFQECLPTCRQFHRKQRWCRWGSIHRRCALSWRANDRGARVGHLSYGPSHTCTPRTLGRLAHHERQVPHYSRCRHQHQLRSPRDRTGKNYDVFQCSCIPLGNFTAQRNTRRFREAHFRRDPCQEQHLHSQWSINALSSQSRLHSNANLSAFAPPG